MNFNKHSELEGKHAFLSASKYHWINYDVEKLNSVYTKYLATLQGTKMHEFASECIKLRITLPKKKDTLNQYVNDAIKYSMTPEQVLYFSDNCFGTADAICFEDGKLRIHDLKTGATKTSIHQLEVYAALFCLEYDINPEDIQIELRLYQNNEVLTDKPLVETIRGIMDKIAIFDQEIESIKEDISSWHI